MKSSFAGALAERGGGVVTGCGRPCVVSADIFNFVIMLSFSHLESKMKSK
jgi:hypothetical protein